MKLGICVFALLVSVTSVSQIKLIDEKGVNKGFNWMRCSLIEVGGHEYVVFSHTEAIHSQHHAGCKACTPKPPVVMYQTNPSVETDIRTTVICRLAFGFSDNTGGSGVYSFTIRNYTIDELKRASDGWDSTLDMNTPSRISFHITKSVGCMLTVSEKDVSYEEFMKKIRPQERNVSNEEWRSTVIKNLEKFPSLIPV